jgi:hypothetical protein
MGFGQFIGENGVADVDFSSHVDSEMAGFLLILQVVFLCGPGSIIPPATF